MPIIHQVTEPKDIKQLTLAELQELANEIRTLLLNKVSQTGGHVGPNLGVVELTIALHYVFNSPQDKLVWDVSHQSYPHKILTGRKHSWIEEEHFSDVTGFTEPKESEHDFFTVGHTSTSISLAVGMAKARDLLRKEENIVAIIGDGSLSGGLAFEGLNNAGELNSNLLIVVNDNDMSIAENHGGLYEGLRKLRKTNGKGDANLFTAMGLDYLYVEEGNNIDCLISALQQVKDCDHPVVLHIHTEKGHGYSPAIQQKEAFHWRMPFDLTTGESLASAAASESYETVVFDVLNKKISEENLPIVAITAGIPGVFRLKEFQTAHPTHYLDVGIAEQHSITTAAGLAAAGARPVVFHSSTFLQRAYDQLSHDVGINSLPVVMIVKGGSIRGGDPTHQGIFDIPYITSIPKIVYLAPINSNELSDMLNWALEQTAVPVAIRIPEHGFYSDIQTPAFHSLEWQVTRSGKQVAILAAGGFYPLGEEVWQQLAATGISATLINPRSYTELDCRILDSLPKEHQLIITLEDGALDGGYGEKIDRYYSNEAIRIRNYGAKKRFNQRETTEELYQEFRLKPALIVDDILSLIQ